MLSAPEAPHSTLKVATQNCWWGNDAANFAFPSNRHRRFRPLLERIKNEHDPDVLFLQEILWTKDIPVIEEVLEKYTAIFISIPRAIRVLLPNILGGLVTMVKKELEPRHAAFQEFTKQGKFFHPQFFEKLLRKGVLSTVIQMRNQMITLSNTHLVSIPNAEEQHKRARRDKSLMTQLREVRNLMIRKADLILGGDFNICIRDNPFQEFLKQVPGMVHLTKKLEEATCGDFGMIDGIQASDTITHDSQDHNQGYMQNEGESDHLGVMTSIPLCIGETRYACGFLNSLDFEHTEKRPLTTIAQSA
ncbi:MAG: hypothetical protein U1C97_00050 [Candidatus Gracilibacteria bacterium]|nr:hypothetical protein [bacterium]MDZ4216694.1 hypothetical protein [Candidatus Gracilibacteria bacterium]